MSGLQRAWLARGPLACLLWPLSLVYGALAALHRSLYALGLRSRERLPVPVVVVGNVVAGGAGKTPVVLALLEHLRQRGLRPGVVSRGYGRSGDACREVQPGDDPRDSGDEPLLLRRKGGTPVFVARRRAEAGRALLRAYPLTQVIVSDDGLQHHALARDLEICVFDRRGIGNGWLLPAGPLREPWPRPADFVLCDAATPPPVQGDVVQRALAAEAVRGDGARRPLAQFGSYGVHAVAGIANPDAFFDMLRAAGIPLAATHAFADHAEFREPLPFPADATLLCTEKDAVKLWRVRPDAWAVPLELRIAPSFWERFDRALEARL